MEGSIITDALQQTQISPEEFLFQVLLSTTELLEIHHGNKNLFAQVIMLHFKILNFMKILNVKSVWNESTTKIERTTVSSFQQFQKYL